MKLCSLLALLAALYASVITLAIVFQPEVPSLVTRDWREAKQYERDCEGDTRIVYDISLREFEVFCKEKR